MASKDKGENTKLDLDGRRAIAYQFGMTTLRELRIQARLSQAQLAVLASTSQPQIKRLEQGERKLTKEWAERLAPHLNVTADQILFPEERMNIVGVKGIISAGGLIETGNEQSGADGNLFEVAVPFDVPEGAFALQVKGDSMYPRYDPDDVIICFQPSEDPSLLVGVEAAVATPDGNRYLKKLLNGSRKGLYTLESHNAAPIRDVKLAWASDIYATVRAHQWHRFMREVGKKSKRPVEAAE